MERPRIKEAIVVEGRYDKNTLLQCVDAVVLETSGFGIFSDSDKLALLRRVAEKRGLIVLTDSDGAGFTIRNYLKGALPKDRVLHAYIPDIAGKERRKAAPSRAGTLGVEGMDREVLLDALRRAGASFEGAEATSAPARLTKAGLFALGLSGRPDSASRRNALKARLGLPALLSSGALLDVLNALYTPEELSALL